MRNESAARKFLEHPTPVESQSASSLYYVYVYYDEEDVPRYVGLGRNNRWKEHLKWSGNKHLKNKVTQLRRKGVEMRHEKVIEGLTHEEACAEEIRLIALYGRIDVDSFGTLYNLMAGGQGGLSPSPEVNEKRSKSLMGHVVLPHVREAVSRANKGRVPHNRGKFTRKAPVYETKEQRATRLKVQSERMKGSGNFMYSVPSPMAGKKHTAEICEKIAKAKRGSNNPQYGKPRTPEQNEAHSKLLRERGREKRALLPPAERDRLEKKAASNCADRLRKLANLNHSLQGASL